MHNAGRQTDKDFVGMCSEEKNKFTLDSESVCYPPLLQKYSLSYFIDQSSIVKKCSTLYNISLLGSMNQTLFWQNI